MSLRLSVNRIYKFDLRSIYRAELSPLTGAIKILPSHKYLLTTYIIYLVRMALFNLGPRFKMEKDYLHLH